MVQERKVPCGRWAKAPQSDFAVVGTAAVLRFAMRDSFVMVANGAARRRLVDGQAAA